MQVTKTNTEVCPAYGVPEIGRIFKWYRKLLRAPMVRASSAVWGHAPPEKIFVSENLKTLFPALSGR